VCIAELAGQVSTKRKSAMPVLREQLPIPLQKPGARIAPDAVRDWVIAQ
jgi:hypothetical protein